MDAKQKYIVGMVRSALADLNGFLNDNEVDFALRPDQMEALNFVFGARDGAQMDLEIRLSDAVPDEYGVGRIIGRVYHEAQNPNFKRSRDRPEKVHVGRIIEHAFAMLHLRSKDGECDLDDILTDYPSSRDPKLDYTLLSEEEDPLDPKAGQGGKGKSAIDKAFEQARKEVEAERKRKKKDEEFKVDKYVEQVTRDEFDVPELKGYKDRELGGDDALSAIRDKIKDEAYKTARAMIEGRDEGNWKRTLSAALYKDVDDAKKYLSGILGY